MSKIELIRGSCVEQNADVIVNAANSNLLSGGGICGAIFSRAGYEELTESCRKFDTPLKDGSAVITPSFNITNAQYIIHAVGPDFGVKPAAYNELFEAYYNSLIILKENELHSIAFPLISAGIFGGYEKRPAENSARQCLKAYTEFCDNFPEYEIEVKLCAFTLNEMEEVKQVFEEMGD